MQDLTVALVQMDIRWEDPGENIRNIEILLSSLKKIPDLVVLPEMFTTGFSMQVERCSETTEGPSVTFLKRMAAEMGCVFTATVLTEDQGRFYNRMYWVKPDRSFEYYDKRHLFSMAGEHHRITQGTKHRIVDLKGWKINLQVCYDLRFPVWSRNTYSDGRYAYDVLIYVANWPERRKVAYLALLPARAIENTAFVVWVNRVGEDGNGVQHSGDSMAVSPTGRILASCEQGREHVVDVTLQAAELDDLRRKFRIGPDWDRFQIL